MAALHQHRCLQHTAAARRQSKHDFLSTVLRSISDLLPSGGTEPTPPAVAAATAAKFGAGAIRSEKTQQEISS